VDLQNPDFVKLAEAYGGAGVRVSQPEQLSAALESAWRRELPTVIDVPVALPPEFLGP
jgi:acetolactate synthase-1/2/3 large subunit